jgi:hypothetical protein
MYILNKYDNPDAGYIQTWSFFSGVSDSDLSAYPMYYMQIGIPWWILVFVNVAVVQAPLTLELHCSELIANVIRDERQWRCATGRKGLKNRDEPGEVDIHSSYMSCTFRCEAFPA